MYESPIEVMYGEIHSKMVKDSEDQIMYEVNRQVGIHVDKDELLRALQHERNQYKKGYADAMADIREKLIEIIETNSFTTIMKDPEFPMGEKEFTYVNIDCFNDLFESGDKE